MSSWIFIAASVSLARAAFGQLHHVWRSRQLSLRLKRELLLSCVASVLLFGSEHWTLDAAEIRLLQQTGRSFLRNALCLRYWEVVEQHIRDLALHQWLRFPSVLTLLHRRLARWLGHLARLPCVASPGWFFLAFCKIRLLRLPLVDDSLTIRGSTAFCKDSRMLTQESGRSKSLTKPFGGGWCRPLISPRKGAQYTAPEAKERLQPRRRAPEQDLHCPHVGCIFTGLNLQGLSRHIHFNHGSRGSSNASLQVL